MILNVQMKWMKEVSPIQIFFEINKYTVKKEDLKRGFGSQKKSKVLLMNSIIKLKPTIKKKYL